MPVETANELLHVTVPDGHIATRVTTGRGPHDAATDALSVNWFSRSAHAAAAALSAAMSGSTNWAGFSRT